MRMSARRTLTTLTFLAVGAFGLPAPTEAAAPPGAIAGSCDLVSIAVRAVPGEGRNELTTPAQGLCAITEYNGVNLVGNAAQVGSIQITSPNVAVDCSGSAVRGVHGSATVAIRGQDTDTFHVALVVDSAPGAQSLNPTATTTIDGLRFAGVGTFTRSGSGSCAAGTATWTLGHLTFEDPTF